jgi:hypothetical protein
MRKLFKIVPAVIATFALTSVFSYGDYSSKENTQCSEIKVQDPTTIDPHSPGYNAPARVDIVDGWDCFTTGSFLYWKASEKDLDLGFFTRIVADPQTGEVEYNVDLIKMDFDFQPGFKVGFGTSFDRDDWNLFTEYTRFHSKNSNSKNANTENDEKIYSPWIKAYKNLVSSDTVIYDSYTKATWKLNLDLIDLEMGRDYHVGKKVTFSSLFGLSGGFLDQKYNTQQLNIVDVGHVLYTVNIQSKNKSTSWLMGPRATLKTNWDIGSGFSFFGDIAASLFYQKIKQNQDYLYSLSAASITSLAKNKKDQLTPKLELGLGFAYGTYFADNKWHFDISTGYDFNLFWDQNYIRYFNDKTYADDQSFDIGNLMLHGLTISARLDF